MNTRLIRAVLIKSAKIITNLNLFQSIPPSVNEHHLKNERISTRLFMLLLALSLVILLLYNSLITVIKTDSITKPTFEQYEQLYETHPITLTCPCETILISYETILNINYTLHQVCTSFLTSEQWFMYLYNTSNNISNGSISDSRQSVPFLFQALSVFCQLANRTISDGLFQFRLNQYISTTVTPENLFQSQIQTFIRQFNSSITKNFIRSLDLVQSITHTNVLYSARQTNYRLSLLDNATHVGSVPVMYSECDCYSSAKCTEQVSVSTPDAHVLSNVSGLYRGCYTIEALLQSTLECFYDQICINNLRSYLNISSTVNMTALDSSSKTRYSVKSTIKELLDQLMIEEWNPSWSYESYYNECQPIECTYIHETKNGIVYIITALFGLVGGLITVLKIVVPRLVKFIRWIIRKWRKKITPQMSTVGT
ncbi:unnamed protein product [Adineta ricciae]|uniref:Uncharacterized protein n=1 Tax=Adineta ricciae TaxID=249248 RepID=A0A814FWQ0_ADIRI|nr:unnamed protein product [Adineta ricciae]